MIAGDERGSFDHDRARVAIKAANLPTLLMVLFHLTGDRRWLAPPYTATRSRGLDPNDSGGYSDAIAAELRAAALTALDDWAAGAAPAVTVPDDALLGEMLAVAMGEPVPPEYVPMASAEFGSTEPPSLDPAPVGSLRAIVIGAGLSGLLAALRLRQQGIETVVFEKGSEVGGTWWLNRYPGAGVDTPSYLYSYSFFPRDWSHYYSKRHEVAEYLRDMAEHFELNQLIELETEVVDATLDEATCEWRVRTRRGDGSTLDHRADLLVSAVGFLNVPKVPDLHGMDEFTGEMFHSAEWPEHTDLRGKRVAVVGTGASSVQIVPAIADDVAELKVFQRTPQWIAPAANYFAEVGEDVHWLMRHVPFYFEWYRLRLAWIFNDKVHASLQIDPDWPHLDRSLNEVNEAHRQSFLRHAREQLEGRPDLQAKVAPSYPPFGKRMLLDNNWYATLSRDDVELISDEVTEFTASEVLTREGGRHEVDVVVLATGFKAQHFLGSVEVRGRGGRRLADRWELDNASAYLGITTPEFPNLFILYGPNTNAAGGSYIFIAECQVHYLVDLIRKMVDAGAAAIEPRADVHDEYNRLVDDAHSRMVWSHQGMDTYYRNSRGRVVTNLPWRVVEYWAMTRRADLADYELLGAARAIPEEGTRG